MAITGCLSEFSLAELFQFLDQGQKTGLLSIRDLPDPQSGKINSHYIWFNQGRILGAANRLDNRGLLALINRRGWIGDRISFKFEQFNALNTPLGIHLKSQNLLQAEQLKLLFSIQVLRQVCNLFTLRDGNFEFQQNSPIPMAEMTGLSTPATEVTLAGLRALRDWSSLEERLPDPSSALLSAIDGKPKLHINQTEYRVWEFTDGNISITEIAEQLKLPVEKVQQIAFRLMMVGLAEEVPLVIFSSAPEQTPELEAEEETSPMESAVSSSFLENLVGFLQSKV